MPMDEATKERLRAAADAKKGRSSLKGLDKTFAGIVLDELQDRLNEFSEWYRYSVNVGLVGGGRQVPDGKNIPGLFPNYSYWRRVSEFNTDPAWIRLRYCPEWVTDEFKTRFRHRFVSLTSFQGPRRGNVMVQYVVFPLAVGIGFLWLVWPGPKDFHQAVRRYAMMISQVLTDRRPGVGSIVETHHGTGRVVEVESIGAGGRVKLDDEPTGTVRFDLPLIDSSSDIYCRVIG